MEKEINLVAKTKSFDITISNELETKIRILCNKFPHNEYSGTLFYRVEGSFEERNLHIKAEDFYLQDIGNGAYTEFNNDATMASYMVEHGLFDCYHGLLHSHHGMATIFTPGALGSRTDMDTLRSEGIDNNHFVSIIVNNAGDYAAAITRKVTKITKGEYTTGYNTFNNTRVELTSAIPYSNEEVDCIEYYMLNIHKPNVVIPKSELELRIETLQRDQNSVINKKSPFSFTQTAPKEPVFNTSKEAQLSLFDAEEVSEKYSFEEEDDFNNLHFNTEIIKQHAAQIITGNIFAAYSPTLDLDKWTSNMETIYKKRFAAVNEDTANFNFKYCADTLIDTLNNEAYDECLLKESNYDESLMSYIWARDLIAFLAKYPHNKYLDYYISSLERYII